MVPRLLLAIIVAFAFALPASLPNAATAQQFDAEAQKTFRKAMRGNLGCTRAKRSLSRLKRKYPDTHFAFTGRKAGSITGMRGCGWAYESSQARANALAMARCEKHERNMGTDGGRKICTLRDL